MIENGVFYNPVQIFNRDFTLLVMQGYINQLKSQSMHIINDRGWEIWRG